MQHCSVAVIDQQTQRYHKPRNLHKVSLVQEGYCVNLWNRAIDLVWLVLIHGGGLGSKHDGGAEANQEKLKDQAPHKLDCRDGVEDSDHS